MSLQIQRSITPDPNTRAYFSREVLTTKDEGASRGGPHRPRSPFLATALEIPGVAVATVTPYALIISKAPMFSWEEIEPSLLRLLSAFNTGEGRLEEN